MVWTVAQCDSFDCQDGLGWMFTLESQVMKRMYTHHAKGEAFNFGVIEDVIPNRYPGVKLKY